MSGWNNRVIYEGRRENTERQMKTRNRIGKEEGVRRINGIKEESVVKDEKMGRNCSK